MKRKLLLMLLVLVFTAPVFAQKATTIWIVRHAEKDGTNPKAADPDLSEEGKMRAMALQKELKGEKIDSIYTTNYKRTKLTALPLADRMGITLKTYNPAMQKQLAEYILKHGEGKKYLVVGHSNTIQELIIAFGLEKPVKDLTEEDYDYLFEVTIKGDKKEVKVNHYGKRTSS
ncbi:MAG: histidine phosphatase family protein [Pedobacter sp.]|jgi:2,3-bisphosphoglycerate-dependent phosphoglycerate mutase|nr:MAG: histidine phosphatase family protein [Pedobacter sp.]